MTTSVNDAQTQTGSSEIRGLILDYGEVLCSRPTTDDIARMAKLVDLDPATFVERYDQDRLRYDRGELSPEEYWSSVVSEQADLDTDSMDTLRRWDIEMWSNVSEGMIEWARQVRSSGIKTALLSNMPADLAANARQSFKWLQEMDYVVLSCEVGVVKPNPTIYELCLEGLKLQPFEVLFIDDREVNVQGARDAGLKAVRFESVERLREDLARMGFPVLPPTDVDVAAEKPE